MATTIVELVGLAGAGKSTLIRELCTRDSRICGSAAIKWTSYLKDAPALMPLFVDLHRPFRTVRLREMKRALHLKTLARLVSRTDAPHVIVLDEGPVYMLTRQLVLGASAMDNDAFYWWWQRTLDHWAHTLHLVVWLDADSACLAQRIRQRPGRPPIRDVRDESLLPFLERYRSAFARVLAALSRRSGPTVLPIDTEQLAPEAIAARVLMEIPNPQ